MTPEEFTESLRQQVQDDFPKIVESIYQAFSVEDEPDEGPEIEEIQSFLDDPTPVLVDKAGFTIAQANESSKIVNAIVKSREFNKYMTNASKILFKNPVVAKVLLEIQDDPAMLLSLSTEKQNTLFDAILSTDELLSGAMYELLNDELFRAALGLKDDVTFEKYIFQVRKALRDSNTLMQLGESTKLGDTHFSFLAVPTIAVFVLATVVLLVHTAIAAVNYVAATAVIKTNFVFTVAGVVDGRLGLEAPPTECPSNSTSAFMNRTTIFVWLILDIGNSVRRVPVPPGKSSADLGLSRIEAILIGGCNNELQSLQVQEGEVVTNGIYIIHNDKRLPGVVELIGCEKGFMIKKNASQECAEALGKAGYTDLNVGGTCDSSHKLNYSMRSTAALFPPGFDTDWLSLQAEYNLGYYNALRFVAAILGKQGRQND